MDVHCWWNLHVARKKEERKKKKKKVFIFRSILIYSEWTTRSCLNLYSSKGMQSGGVLRAQLGPIQVFVRALLCSHLPGLSVTPEGAQYQGPFDNCCVPVVRRECSTSQDDELLPPSFVCTLALGRISPCTKDSPQQTKPTHDGKY